MSCDPLHPRSTRRHRCRPAPPRCLRRRRTRLRQDHRAGGILPPTGGRRRRSLAHPGHHLHREGRRQHAQETGAGLPAAARNARQTGARLGLHRARLLRAPAARKRRVRRHRPRVRRARRHPILAHAAGIHARRHRRPVRAAPRSHARPHPRALQLRIRAGRALRLRHHARRRSSRRATRRFPRPRRRHAGRNQRHPDRHSQSEPQRLELRAEAAPGGRAGRRRAHPQRGEPAGRPARHRGLYLQSHQVQARQQRLQPAQAHAGADRRGGIRPDHRALRPAARRC